MTSNSTSSTSSTGGGRTCALCDQNVDDWNTAVGAFTYTSVAKFGVRSYCPECDMDYCEEHYPVGPRESYAPGVDHQYGEAGCPEGHFRKVYED